MRKSSEIDARSPDAAPALPVTIIAELAGQTS
jgi:hypothetical protein